MREPRPEMEVLQLAQTEPAALMEAQTERDLVSIAKWMLMLMTVWTIVGRRP